MAFIPLARVLVIVLHILGASSSNVNIQSVAPAVGLDAGTFVGVGDSVTHKFLGIPFAKPPYVIATMRAELLMCNLYL